MSARLRPPPLELTHRLLSLPRRHRRHRRPLSQARSRSALKVLAGFDIFAAAAAQHKAPPKIILKIVKAGIFQRFMAQMETENSTERDQLVGSQTQSQSAVEASERQLVAG
jgi:hypothetical protein